MKTGALIGAALIMVSTAVNADVSATEEMAFDVKSGARVSLDNINGEIRIVGGPGEPILQPRWTRANLDALYQSSGIPWAELRAFDRDLDQIGDIGLSRLGARDGDESRSPLNKRPLCRRKRNLATPIERARTA